MQQQAKTIEDLRAELSAGMLAQLTPAEREELGNLNARLQALQPDQEAASNTHADAKVRYPLSLAASDLLAHLPGCAHLDHQADARAVCMACAQ